MTAIDVILEGLEAELALERELGVRFLECDRALLAPPVRPVSDPPPVRRKPPAAPPPPARLAPPPSARPAPPAAAAGPAGRSAKLDFVFLHDRPLSAAGMEMMAKIVAALDRTPETAPVLHDGALPSAKVHVVLGSAALKKWFPGQRAAPGQWISCGAAPNVLVTYSPAFLLRFSAGADALQQIKKGMWQSLKSVLQRVRE